MPGTADCERQGRPCLIATLSKHPFPKLPGIVITESGAYGLGDLGRGDQNVGSEVWAKVEGPGYGSGDAVDGSKQGRMDGRPELVFPLLSHVSLDATTTITTTDPGDPRTTVCAKGKFPGRLQGLEVFIRLKECLDTQRVQDAKSDEEDEDILRSCCCLDAVDGSPLKNFSVV